MVRGREGSGAGGFIVAYHKKEYFQAYYEANKTKLRKQQKKYYENNKDKAKKAVQKYYNTDKGKIKYEEHKKKMREYNRQFRAYMKEKNSPLELVYDVEQGIDKLSCK